MVTALLSKDKEFSDIICGTNDIKRARTFIKPHPKVSVEKVDASKTADVARLAKNADIILNASLPNFNCGIMEAAIKVGANYQDLCSWLQDLKTPEQLRHDKTFKKAGLVGLINTGASPGITNMFAAEAADQLDRVNDIKIRLLEEQRAHEFIFSWSPAVTFDEFASPPLVYKNRKFVFTKPFGDAEDYTFPAPFGKKCAYRIYGDEVSTLPLYIKAKNVDYKAAGADIEFAKALSTLGLFRKQPVQVKGANVTPVELFTKIAPPVPTPKELIRLVKKNIIENAILVTVVELTGTKNGKKKSVRKALCYPDIKEITHRMPGATYVSYPTGIAAAAFAKSIQHIHKTGVFPPEALDKKTRAYVLDTLMNLGITLGCPIKKFD